MHTLSRSRWSVPGIYLCLSVAFFLPAILRTQIPVSLESAYLFPDPYWEPYTPSRLSSLQNLTLVDVTHFYYPYMVAALERLKAGEIPLWNPDIFSGMPFMGAHQPAVLYPLNLVFAPLGPYWIWTATGIVRLLLMGWGLHLLMRRFGLSHIAAFWSGVTYQFASSNIAWLHYSVHNVLALLPLALYSTDRLLAAPRGRWFLLLTASLALQFLGGHPETSVLFVLLWAGFTLLRVPWRRYPRRSLTLLAGAGVAAIGIVMPQLLATAELIPQSATFFTRTASPDDAAGVVRGSWNNLRSWLLLVNPYLYGTPVGSRYLTQTSNYNELATYLGIFTVPFAVVGVLGGRPRRVTCYWGIVAVLSLAQVYALPGFARLRELPVLNLGHGIRYIFSSTLALAILAGFGAEALRREPRRWRYVAAGAASLSFLLLVWSVYDIATAADGSWILNATPQPEILRTIADFYNRGSVQLLGLLAAAGLGWMVLATLLWTKRAALAPAALLVLTTVELFVHGVPYNGFAEPRLTYPQTAITRALKAEREQFRVSAMDNVMDDSTSMTQDLHNAMGLDDLVPVRYLLFAGRMSKIGLDNGAYVVLPQAQRFFDLANVEYLLTTRRVDTAASAAPWELVMQDGPVNVYRNPAVLPRAYAVPAVRTATAEQALSAVYEETFDPRREAIVEERIPELEQQAATPTPARVSITRYAPEQVEVDVETSGPELLVLGDSYASGWRVAVDGSPSRLYRANAVYRGVVVPAGHHRVVFTYRPASWEIGRIVALVTAIACVGGCLVSRYRVQARG